MPIAIHVVWGLKANNLKPGPFTLGKWSKPVNVAALAWGAYLVTFLCFPTVMPVNSTTMNYSCLVLGFGFVLAAVTWFIYGKRDYRAAAEEVPVEATEVAVEIVQEGPKRQSISKDIDY